MPARILVIDDEESMCNFLEIMLEKAGYDVQSTVSGTEGVARLKEENFDLVITDLMMPEMSGLEILKKVRNFKASQEFIVMTAFASVETAIEAMKRGAADYITKPFKVDEIKLVIEKLINRQALISENKNLKKQLQDDNSFDKFIGNSETAMALKKLARRVASSESTVLIRGESGTGKDLIARGLHHHSPRCKGPFITINCGALPETLLESELFGHVKGAFTGAIKDKDGLFRVADGGTFFLDEVGTTSLAIQVKLLRVLENKQVTPIGSTRPIDVDVRLLAATNSDLEAEVKANRFRADLFYRLNVIPINIPPLRERREDIKGLVSHFIDLHGHKAKDSTIHGINREALRLLEAYNWPGNVRELENTIERAILFNRSQEIEPADLPDCVVSPEPERIVTEATPETPTLESIEKAYIHFVMSQTNGHKAEAARILGIDASTLYRKIDRYRLKEIIPPSTRGRRKSRDD